MTPSTPPNLPPRLPQAMPPAKNSSALKWVLLGIGAFVLLGVLMMGLGSYFVYRAVKNVGFDSELMRRNPGLALTKMATAMNPDMETVSTDDHAGTITMREKSTGKIATFKFDPDKKTLVVVGDDGQQVKFSASGDGKNGSLEVQAPDGTFKAGSDVGTAVAAWIPVYPGTAPRGVLSSQTGDGSQNTYAFKTPDSPAKVLAYYQDQLKSAGYTVNTMTSTGSGGIIHAQDSARKRTLMITASVDGGSTSGSITAVETR